MCESIVNKCNSQIAIYDPYIFTLGGGEKYICLIAEYFLNKENCVDIIINNKANINIPQFLEDIRNRLNTNLNKVKVVTVQETSIDKFLRGILDFYPSQLKHYDLVVYLTNHIPNVTFNKNSLAVIQFPFDGPLKFSVSNKHLRRLFAWFMLYRYKALIVYSKYVAQWVQKYWGKKTLVLNPAIDIKNDGTLNEKTNIILNVGRYFEHGHSKKQLEMIEIFREMCDAGLRGWQLVLVGGIEEDKNEYLEKLIQAAEGYSIEIKVNVSYAELSRLYRNSKIYWHATGFNENGDMHPERNEHFGITTLEAMASGCVPIVINRGGQSEVVENGKNGYLWDTKEQLISLTSDLIHNSERLAEFSMEAVKTSENFGKDVFFNKFESILDEYVFNKSRSK